MKNMPGKTLLDFLILNTGKDMNLEKIEKQFI